MHTSYQFHMGGIKRGITEHLRHNESRIGGNERGVFRADMENAAGMINKFNRFTRNGLELEILDVDDEDIRDRVLEMERVAYVAAGIRPEGVDYFGEGLRGVDADDGLIHFGIKDKEDELLAYFSIFRAGAGEFVFGESNEAARVSDKLECPNYVFSKLIRDPDEQVRYKLARSGVLRVALGGVMLKISNAEKGGYLMETHAQVGSMRLLESDMFNTIFPDAEWLLREQDDAGDDSPEAYKVLMYIPNTNVVQFGKSLAKMAYSFPKKKVRPRGRD